MVDIVDVGTRSRMMAGIKGRGTRPEKLVRSKLHQLGFRFSRTLKVLGRPDAVLPKWHVAIFVHGCFWHLHGCRLSKPPSSNVEFWRVKLAANRVRDEQVRNELLASGWRVVTIWECALRGALQQQQFVESLGLLAHWIRSRPDENTYEILDNTGSSAK